MTSARFLKAEVPLSAILDGRPWNNRGKHLRKLLLEKLGGKCSLFTIRNQESPTIRKSILLRRTLRITSIKPLTVTCGPDCCLRRGRPPDPHSPSPFAIAGLQSPPVKLECSASSTMSELSLEAKLGCRCNLASLRSACFRRVLYRFLSSLSVLKKGTVSGSDRRKSCECRDTLLESFSSLTVLGVCNARVGWQDTQLLTEAGRCTAPLARCRPECEIQLSSRPL